MANLRTTFSPGRSRVQSIDATQPPARRARRPNLVADAEIVTFLPLQVALYFNVFYSPLWVVSCIFALQHKYDALATHYKFVTILVYIVMFVVEAARLYLAYEGNLREKVPELAGFWLLTLLQTPLTVYLLGNINTIVLPLETAVNIVLLAFLLAHVVLGFRALQLMVRAQAVKFHLSHFDSLDR